MVWVGSARKARAAPCPWLAQSRPCCCHTELNQSRGSLGSCILLDPGQLQPSALAFTAFQTSPAKSCLTWRGTAHQGLWGGFKDFCLISIYLFLPFPFFPPPFWSWERIAKHNKPAHKRKWRVTRISVLKFLGLISVHKAALSQHFSFIMLAGFWRGCFKEEDSISVTALNFPSRMSHFNISTEEIHMVIFPAHRQLLPCPSQTGFAFPSKAQVL